MELSVAMRAFRWVLVCLFFQHVLSQGGPYRFVFNQLAVCDEPVGEFHFPTKISKKSRSIITYTCKPCILGKDVDDSTSLTLNYAKYGNGGWRPNYLTLHYRHFCKDTWPIIGKNIENLLSENHTRPITCPLKAGNYTIDGYEFGYKKYEKVFPVLPYGKFRLDVDFRKKSTRIGCLRLFIDIVPRNKKKGNIPMI